MGRRMRSEQHGRDCPLVHHREPNPWGGGSSVRRGSLESSQRFPGTRSSAHPFSADGTRTLASTGSAMGSGVALTKETRVCQGTRRMSFQHAALTGGVSWGLRRGPEKQALGTSRRSAPGNLCVCQKAKRQDHLCRTINDAALDVTASVRPSLPICVRCIRSPHIRGLELPADLHVLREHLKNSRQHWNLWDFLPPGGVCPLLHHCQGFWTVGLNTAGNPQMPDRAPLFPRGGGW